VLASLDEKDEEIRKLKRKLLNPASQPPEIKERKGIKLVSQKLEEIDLEALRSYADNLKQKIGSGIIFLASAADDRAWLVVAVTADLTQKLQANKIIKEIAPVIGGGGGGRADFAQAGGNQPQNIDLALKAGVELAEKLI
jgi:alanyl-tRNA synthetase